MASAGLGRAYLTTPENRQVPAQHFPAPRLIINYHCPLSPLTESVTPKSILLLFVVGFVVAVEAQVVAYSYECLGQLS